MNELTNPYASPAAAIADEAKIHDPVSAQLHVGLGLVLYATLAMAVVSFVEMAMGGAAAPLVQRGLVWGMVALNLARFAGQVLCGSVPLTGRQTASIYAAAFFQLWLLAFGVLLGVSPEFFWTARLELGIDLVANIHRALGCLSLTAVALFVKQTMEATGMRGASRIGGYAFWVMLLSSVAFIGAMIGVALALWRDRLQPPDLLLSVAMVSYVGIGIGFVLLLVSLARLRRALRAASPGSGVSRLGAGPSYAPQEPS